MMPKKAPPSATYVPSEMAVNSKSPKVREWFRTTLVRCSQQLAAEMLATTLNVEFDPDLSWDEKKEVYRISNKIVRTMNVTQSAVGDKRGLWTTVLGAAILIGEDD